MDIKKKILVVEDNHVNAKMIRDFMQFKGFDITCVSNSGEVIPKVMEIHPDLILMDIQIFGISGLEIAKMLKSNKETATIPIFMLSAFSKDNFPEISQDYYDEYIEKPIVFSILLELISNYLDN